MKVRIVPIMLGFIVGIFASIMGVGGAFLMVPAMIYIIGIPTKLVPGTSLFVTIFITALVVIGHAFRFQTIDFILVINFIIRINYWRTFWFKSIRKIKCFGI